MWEMLFFNNRFGILSVAEYMITYNETDRFRTVFVCAYAEELSILRGVWLVSFSL